MAHMAHCIELSVASNNSSEVPTTISSESSTLISSTPSIAVESTHISSSTLNNMPSSTIGSMITASVVIPTSSEEETVVENVSKSDKSMEKMEKESENDDKSVSVGITSFTVEHLSSTASTEPSTIMTTTNNNNNEKTTTAEPIPSSLPLVQQSTVIAQVATNESDINNVTTMAPQNNNHTNNIVDDPNSNEIHDNEIIDGLSESSKINIDSRVDVVSTNNNKNKKPINIDDFYPSKMEDFKLVIQQSNEKILREKEILRSDEEKSVQNNPLLRPMDLLPIISDKKDLLLEDRSGNTSEIGTTNIEIELIEPDVTKTEQETERETVDITEKLQENDEVIKKIEESFKIDDMDLRPDIIFDIMPSKSSTVPTTIETTTMTPKSTFKMTTSETTTTTVKKLTHDHAPRSHHIPQESGFIPRRVKKNDPKVEGKISVLNRETLKRIDFANTKFKSHSNNNINGAQHRTNLQQQQQNTNNNKYKSTGTGVSSAEFSTTKFYNSKETDINKSNDNPNTVVQTTVMASPSEKLMPTTKTIITTTTNSININNNDNNKKSTTIGIVKTDDDVVLLDDGVSATTVSSTSSSVIDIDNNKNSNNKNVVDMSIMANVYPADIVDSDAIKSSTEITQQPTMKIPVFHPLVRPRVLSRLQEKINQLDCDLQSFPPQPPQNAASGLPTISEEYIKIWRGNETHELSLPIVVS
uniref:CSON014278 protein n=1 Tax=Culicoides sonorensis TaxID=179676 RepID=A0A336MMI6_CULSO